MNLFNTNLKGKQNAATGGQFVGFRGERKVIYSQNNIEIFNSQSESPGQGRKENKQGAIREDTDYKEDAETVIALMQTGTS